MRDHVMINQSKEMCQLINGLGKANKAKARRLLVTTLKSIRAASVNLEKLSEFLIIAKQQALAKQEIESNQTKDDSNQSNQPLEVAEQKPVATKNKNNKEMTVYFKCYRSSVPESIIADLLTQLKIKLFKIKPLYAYLNWSICSIHIKNPKIQFKALQKAFKGSIKGSTLTRGL